MSKHDLKNYGRQGIKTSLQVTIDQKHHKTIGLSVSCLGSLIGALSFILIIKVIFEGSL